MSPFLRSRRCRSSASLRTVKVPGFVAKMAVCFTLIQAAYAQTDALGFFKNYFVTGDYVVAGVGLRGQGDVSGLATGTIQIAGVPENAVVVGAFLYWASIESSDTPSAAEGFFQGYAITGKSVGTQTPPCWSSGGGTGASQGTNAVRVYRADVRRFMVKNGQYKINDSFQVRLRDSGSNGNTKPLTEGASLIVIYRTIDSPLKSVVIYDGAWTMNNSTQSMNLTIKGFYQAQGAATPQGKLTHIVGDGQPNFTERLFFNGAFVADNPFIGAQGYSWDNLTTTVSVPDNASQVTTQVLPISSSFDCLSWGAVVFSTPVKDQDQDGLLDVWEDNQGYLDAKDGSFVALPGADKQTKDLYLQIDFLKKSGSSGAAPHSHLPKLDALNMVGQAFAKRGIHVHFDVGGRYPASQFILSGGRGGNAIDEDSLTCTDGTKLCQFPGAAGILAWKGGVNALKNQYFQHGAKDSYHYMVAGHALGLAGRFWSVVGGSLTSISCCVATGSNQAATVTTANAHGLLPGAHVTVSGAIGDFDLNGTYVVQAVPSPTTFTINTTVVSPATYGNFPAQELGATSTQVNEPNLAVSSGTFTSRSGFADLGGGDGITSLGMWRSDDASGCQTDPTIPLATGQTYCSDRVGTALVQAGTLMHELGHSLLLTHTGFYRNSAGGPVTYGQSCKPNMLSVMNYLFQIRGLPGGNVDYSGQVLPSLDENNLVEAAGLGTDENGQPPAYGTRWYGPPGFLDNLLQNSTGSRIARSHCDGSPMQPGEVAVRLDTLTAGGPIDWNNNGTTNDTVMQQDINFNGRANESGLAGFNDWAALDLRQIGGRRNIAGFSGDIGGSDVFGGGSDVFGGGSDVFGGGSDIFGGGSEIFGGGSEIFGGGSDVFGGGVELDFDLANSTVDPPVGLSATAATKSISLSWSAPAFGQIRTYYVWRADVTKAPISASNQPVNIGSVKGTPPATTFIDNNVKTNVVYEYFVTAALGTDSGTNNGNQSGPSTSVRILAKF